ncbi:unnamed protein product [Trifolium pratense]|uniref:Uncharacterized protein n=2 Tax=Trifolium pratense TaxID=57577 RepID=A0ACB0IFC7_TRIPR|nr:unnamed protein product [Trifolium pratense]CAJ2644185.1 unnamed protein product [Trifolium pratense]
MGADIFSEGFSEHLHLEHIKEVVDHDWLSASAVIVYLYDKLIGPRGLKYKISFLSPHVSFDDIQGKDIARVLMKTKVLKDEKIILAPYNVGIHWVLFFINPDAECPRQRNTIDCGYFIMRFMKEVIMEYPNKIPDNYFSRHRHSTYSKEKLDEVKEEWATHMVEDVINDAKRLQK